MWRRETKIVVVGVLRLVREVRVQNLTVPNRRISTSWNLIRVSGLVLGNIRRFGVMIPRLHRLYIISITKIGTMLVINRVRRKTSVGVATHRLRGIVIRERWAQHPRFETGILYYMDVR